MRTKLIGGLVALVVAALTGCGAVNKGPAFASELEPLLEERELVETSSIVASSSLPWTGMATVSVTLVPGLSDDEMVEEIWEITHLEVDNQIDYTLDVLFLAETATGGPATAGLSLRVSEPAPDEDGPREQILERLEEARALVALGDGDRRVARTVELTPGHRDRRGRGRAGDLRRRRPGGVARPPDDLGRRGRRRQQPRQAG